MKNIILIFLVSIMALFFTSCQNGVSFDPSEVASHETNTEIPEEEDLPEEDSPEDEGIGKGLHSFTLDFATTSELDNFKFIPLQVMHAGINDTTGKGFIVTFNLTIDVPDMLEATPPPVDEEQETPPVAGEQETPPAVAKTLEESTPPPTLEDGDQNIIAKIEDYTMKEGVEKFPTAYFGDDPELKEFTFTNDDDTIVLTVEYPDVATLQRGILPIKFTSPKYNDVYKGIMPRGLSLSVYSKGTTTIKRVTPGVLVEQTNDTVVEVKKVEDSDKGFYVYDLMITDGSSTVSQTPTKVIPLSIPLFDVIEGYDVTVSVKEDSSQKLAVTDIEIGSDKTVKFTATHTGNEILLLAEGTVTLTVDSEHKDVYLGLPFDIVINTKRDHSFKYQIQNYVNNITVSKSKDKLFDNGYYTNVTIPSMVIAGATDADTVTYEIFRQDESSTEFKKITDDAKSLVSVNKGLTHYDYDAFILRKHEQEYKIKITHSSCTNTVKCTSVIGSASHPGSRMLTNRELFLAAMDSMRYALIDSTRTVDSGDHADRGVQDIFRNYIGGKWKYATASGNNGSFKHKMGYWGLYMTHEHLYTMASYKPYFMKLDGSFTYKSDTAIVKSINTIYDNGVEDKAPFTGTVNFTSPYGNGSIIFNSININNDTWSNPGWANGNFTLKMDGEDPITYGKDDVPFGLYMSKDRFVEVLLDKDGNYTQK